MKNAKAYCIAMGLVLLAAAPAGATGLFDDADRTTLRVRSDTADDYAYNPPLYTALRADEGAGWQPVSLPLAGLNEDGTPFDVYRRNMESLRFYLVCKDSRYNDGDDPHIQIDAVRLTKTEGGELVIDDFDDGVLRWSYQEHPAPSSPPGGVSVSLADVTGRGKVLDIDVSDVDARSYGPNWEMNYIDIFTCLTDDARDSFVFGDDWSAYDNLEFDWTVIDSGTRRDYVDLYLRTDAVPEPATGACLLAGLCALGSLARRRRRR